MRSRIDVAFDKCFRSAGGIARGIDGLKQEIQGGATGSLIAYRTKCPFGSIAMDPKGPESGATNPAATVLADPIF